MSSRERMLGAIQRREVDHVPCALMSSTALRGRVQGPYQLALLERSLGFDAFLFIPSASRGERPDHPDLRGLPVRWPSSTSIDLWEEMTPHAGPILHKVYHTPAGDLSTAVRRTVDWPYGSAVPLMGDYQVSRATKHLVTEPRDLEALRTLLLPPHADDITAYREEARRARAFCAAHGLFLVGGWGVGGDMAGWLCGLQNMALMTIDDPETLLELLAIIADWNATRMRVVLEGGVDLYVRRAWYESADFWSPRLYRRFLLPILQREADLCHAYGTPLGLIMTTGLLPLAGDILASGTDVLIGVDPLQTGGDGLAAIRDRLAARMCLWGGVNAALTLEQGSPEDVRMAVASALETMRGLPGFILSPVDNVTAITPQAWANLAVFMDAWQRMRSD